MLKSCCTLTLWRQQCLVPSTRRMFCFSCIWSHERQHTVVLCCYSIHRSSLGSSYSQTLHNCTPLLTHCNITTTTWWDGASMGKERGVVRMQCASSAFFQGAPQFPLKVADQVMFYCCQLVGVVVSGFLWASVFMSMPHRSLCGPHSQRVVLGCGIKEPIKLWDQELPWPPEGIVIIRTGQVVDRFPGRSEVCRACRKGDTTSTSLRVRSTTTVICGIIVALDSSEP
jgi:hypothetical protein